MKPEESDFTAGASPGERLKAKRTELGVSLKEVSNVLLISVANLEALENNRYEDLPGLTYIIGYWRSYANVLNLDISDEIEIYKNEIQPSGALSAYHVGQHVDVHQKKVRKGSFLLFALLFAGFIGGLWYWQSPVDNRTVPLNGNPVDEPLNTLDNGNNAADEVVANSTLSVPELEEIEQPDLPVDGREPTGAGMDADADADAQPEAEAPEVPEESVSGSADPSGSSVEAQEPVVTGTNADVDADVEAQVQTGSGDSGVPSGVPEVPEAPEAPEEPVSGSVDSPGSSVGAQEPVVAGTVVDTDTDTDTERTEQGSGPGNEPDSGSGGEVFAPDSDYDASSTRWIKVNVHKTVWIDIRNGQGEKLVFRMVNEGENLEINDSPPFYVFIGSPDGVEVFYLGESVDMPLHSSGLSSRFVVGEYPESTSN